MPNKYSTPKRKGHGGGGGGSSNKKGGRQQMTATTSSAPTTTTSPKRKNNKKQGANKAAVDLVSDCDCYCKYLMVLELIFFLSTRISLTGNGQGDYGVLF
jgi:hypothetical protein